MRRLDVDETEIVRLYRDEGLRAQAIAHRLGISPELVYDRLERAGVSRTRLASLPLDEAVRLYVDERCTTSQIAERFHVSTTTVSRRLHGAGVTIRNRSGPRSRPDRVPCPQSRTFRAYVLGLVWGDFAVDRQTVDGKVIRLKSSTTRREQVALARSVFGAFGDVRYTGRTLWVALHETFEFVDAKHGACMPDWIRGPDASAAFSAGYIDAEGSFGVYEGRGRFRISACDAAVLEWMDGWCRSAGVRSHLHCYGRQGEAAADGTVRRQDLWTMTVNEGQSLLRLIASLEPFARHEARLARMADVRTNVLERAHRRDPDRAVSQLLGDQPR